MIFTKRDKERCGMSENEHGWLALWSDCHIGRCCDVLNIDVYQSQYRISETSRYR